MAPEQWEGQPQDEKTDQYALGVMAYEMLAGRPPFENSELGVLREAVLKGEVRGIAGVSEGAMGALRRALAKKAEERWESCGAFVEALAEGRGAGSRPAARGVRMANDARAATDPTRGGEDLFVRKVRLEKAMGAARKEDATAEETTALEGVQERFEAGAEALRAGDKRAAERLFAQVEGELAAWRKGVRERRERKEREAREERERLAREREARLARERAEREEREREAREREAKLAREKAEREAREREAAEKRRIEREAAEEAEKRRKEAERQQNRRRLWKTLAAVVAVLAVVWGGSQCHQAAERKRIAAERERIAAPLRAGTPQQAGEVRTITLPGGAKMEMVWCPAGAFMMGSPDGEEGRFDNESLHQVTLTKGFWMAKTEVTQGQWKSVMGSNPSEHEGADLPVENVSWNDCMGFCKKTGLTLPTEAQWEYACRAGTTGDFAGTGNLDDMGWYGVNSGGHTHPVGKKQPNAWGLYDMHGNVWEWCADWYGAYPKGAVTNPEGVASGGNRVLRGGGYWNDPQLCRSALRYRHDPGTRAWSHGFRPVARQD